MGVPAIKKCVFCGRLFQSLGLDICPSCSDEADRDFVTIRDYIYDAAEKVSVQDILENTGVEEKKILYFLKEGRLSPQNVQAEGMFKCAACGVPISGGKLCSKCQNAWGAAVKKSVSETNALKQKTTRKMHTFSGRDI